MSVSRSRIRWVLTIAAILLLCAVVAILTVLPRGFREDSRAGQGVPDARTGNRPIEAPSGATLIREVFSVSDATARDGVWYVLDRLGDQVHRVDPAAGLLGSFGRKGGGPGEFGTPRAIVAHGDSIVVLDGRNLRFFDTDGVHIADRTVELEPHCNLNDAVSLPRGLALLVRCSESTTVTYHAVLETPDGSMVWVVSSTRDRGDPITGTVVLGLHPQGFLFGRPYDTCLNLFSSGGTPLGDVCHDWIERLPVPPMPDDIADELASMRRQGRRLGASMTLPEHMPSFTRLSMMGGDQIAYHAPVPGTDRGERLVTQSSTGGQAIVPVPPALVLYVAGNSVLAAWDDLEGMRFLFHVMAELDGEGPPAAPQG